MATKRKRGVSWEYRVRRAGLLPKDLYFTFDTEAEGDAYVARLEAMLDRGEVPAELLRKNDALLVGDLLKAFRATVAVQPSVDLYLDVVARRWGAVRLVALDYDWAERTVEKLKEERLSPIYIGRLVRILAAALDWGVRRKYSEVLVGNPLRLLPRGFSRYANGEVVTRARERRLEPGEDERIRPLLAKHPDRLLMYVLALETAMRLSEIYTLTKDQVDLERRTVFLTRTKNGDSRQVPLSSVAVEALRGFEGFEYGEKSPAATGKLSKYFLRIFRAAGCVDLHFHDLRHEATCRLYERTRLSDVQIAKITGHRDPSMLLRYANLRGSDLAQALWMVAISTVVTFCLMGFSEQTLVNVALI